MSASPVRTIGELARHFGVLPWQVRRLFERDILPPALRVGAYRVILVQDIPAVERALRDAGYLGKCKEATANVG